MKVTAYERKVLQLASKRAVRPDENYQQGVIARRGALRKLERLGLMERREIYDPINSFFVWGLTEHGRLYLAEQS